MCLSELATDAEGESTTGLLSAPRSPIFVLHQVPLLSACIPEPGHPARLLAPSLTFAQKLLGLVGVEVLGFNQHHQEAIGSWEVAD